MRYSLAVILGLALASPAAAVVPTAVSSSGPYACNGSQTAFTAGFKFLDQAHLVVTRSSSGSTSTLTLGADYTATGAGGVTGTVTLTSGAKCPSGTLTIKRVVPLTQATPFSTQGAFSPKAHELAFDRQTMAAQQIDRRVADAEATHATDNVRWTNAIAALNGTSHAQSDLSSVLAFGTTTPRTLTARFAEQFSPLDFGALADGSDDGPRIQAAIDAAAAGGGGTVLLPATGVFTFSPIVVKTNVRLKTLGATLRIKTGTCTDGGTHYPISNLNGGSWYANAVLEDLIVEGNQAGNGVFTVCDAVTFGGDNVHVRNVTITDPPDSGIMFSDPTNSSVEGGRISNPRDVGIYVNDGDGTSGYENRVVGVQITGGVSAIALKRIAQRILVAGNTIYDSLHGITLEQASTTSDYATNITIADNLLRHIGYNGLGAQSSSVAIDLRKSDHVNCIGNRIEDPGGRGIYAQGTIESNISYNIISGTASQDGTAGIGIDIIDRGAAETPPAPRAPSKLIVAYNVVTGQKVHGIRCGGATSATLNRLIGNIATGAGTNGLNVNAFWTNNVFETNVFGGTSADTVYSPAATDNTYRANTHVNGTGSATLGQNIDWTPNAVNTASSFTALVTGARAVLGNVGVASPGLGFAGAGGSIDAVVYRRGANLPGTRDADTFQVGDGTWNGGHLKIGTSHYWNGSGACAGKFMLKSSAPTAECDGTVVGSQ